MDKKIIDLHCHSIFSDGSDTPEELVKMALKKGLSAIALTDHDTVRGVKTMTEAAAGTSLEVVPGVELSTFYKKHEIHIVGLFVDCENKTFLSALNQIRFLREERIRKMCAKLHMLEFDDYSYLLDTLGKTYEIMNLYFKPYTCCRWGHQPIQASIEMMTEKGFTADDIKKVTVHTFDSATQLSKIVPHETDEAQYNIAFPVATAIVCGEVGFRQMNNKALDNPAVLEMMKKLEFVMDPEMEAQFPEKRLAWVEFELNDGTIYKTKVYSANGEATDGIDHKWIVDKFNRILDPIMNERGRKAVQGNSRKHTCLRCCKLLDVHNRYERIYSYRRKRYCKNYA